MIATLLFLLTVTFEVRVYNGEELVASKLFTPTCGVTVPAPIPGEEINGTRIVFVDPTDVTKWCELPEANTWLASLPRPEFGATYDLLVRKCGDGLCSDSYREKFCVGVPATFEGLTSCEEAAAVLVAYWWYCTVLRVCG
jgi:hypothetical protein